MRIGFTSDLHGRDILYTQIDSLLRIEPVDLLILGGDLFPDGVQSDPGSQLQYVRETFLPTVAGWRKRHTGLQVACILGNHDWRKTEDALQEAEKAGDLVLLRPQAAWTHGGVAFIGFSYTPPSPHWLKDFERLDFAQDPVPDFPGWESGADGEARPVTAGEHFTKQRSLDEELRAIARPKDPWILVCHSPPYGGRLDRLPTIEQPLGSRAVARFIATTKPLCALHGHIHEAPEVTGYFKDTIEGVACINPGQVGDRLHAVLFEAERPAETLKHTVFG